jgi:hypothetical protein
MDSNKCLYEYDLPGESYDVCKKSQNKTTLYFDYALVGQENPILKCDFYFNDYKINKKF